MVTETMAQKLSVPVASIRPSNVAFDNTNAVLSAAIDMSKFRRLMAHINAGVVATNGNVVGRFVESATSGGTYTNVASGATLTLNASNTEGTIEMRSDQLGSGMQFVKLSLLTSVANIFESAVLLGGEPHYRPASQFDAANVTRSVMA